MDNIPGTTCRASHVLITPKAPTSAHFIADFLRTAALSDLHVMTEEFTDREGVPHIRAVAW